LPSISVLTLSPTYPQCELTLNLDDYGKKESITIEIRHGGGSLHKRGEL
jgi:hypothetical protein